MIINIIGACDKRPVLYTCMKVLQEFGDVLLITSSSRLMRLSDNGESCGHYQNTMICVTQDGIDDFFDQLKYSPDDFDYIIIDNVVSVAADATIYVEGMKTSENDEYTLSMLDDYSTIKLYKDKLVESQTLYKLEQFEALADMCPMTPKVVTAVCKTLSPILNVQTDRLVKIANSYAGSASGKPSASAGMVPPIIRGGLRTKKPKK